jgi:hypothetical protein
VILLLFPKTDRVTEAQAHPRRGRTVNGRPSRPATAPNLAGANGLPNLPIRWRAPASFFGTLALSDGPW